MKTTTAESLFGLPLDTNPSLTRAVVEHGDGTWSTTVFPASLQKSNPQRPTEAEITFSLPEVFETAGKVFSHEFFTELPEGSRERKLFDKRKRTLLVLASFALQMSLIPGMMEPAEKQEAGF